MKRSSLYRYVSKVALAIAVGLPTVVFIVGPLFIPEEQRFAVYLLYKQYFWWLFAGIAAAWTVQIGGVYLAERAKERETAQ